MCVDYKGCILKIMPIPFYVTSLRLLIPLFILKWPLWGILASSLADMYDWQFVNLATPDDFALYQNWDKAMDLYYWIFALIIISKWKDLAAKRLALGLFIYRIFGMVMFWLSGKRMYLFIFPNVFENFFIFYLLFTLLFKKYKLLSSWKVGAIVFSVLIIPKLIHEYFMHFLEKQPWEFYNVGGYFGFKGFFEEYTNYLVWGSIFYILPFIIGLFWVNKLQTKRG